jgi:hypothetical protein
MALVIAVLLLASSTGLGLAKCASGSPPDYADIEAVMLKQTGCDGTLHPRKVSTFDCSMFYAFFWGPPVNDAQYAQYNLAGSVGTYRLGINLQRVVQVLKRDNFFTLSPPDAMVTDTAESVLTVKRCAVVTRIRVFNVINGIITRVEPPTRRLFADLRRLIDQSPKARVSSKPTDLKYTLLFDP